MSISLSMSNALSGLNVAGRAAETVSNNVANALTEGYARREVQLGARVVGSTGQGVQVTGIARITDPVLTGDRRIAQAGAADRDLRAGFFAAVETALGSPEADGSLTARIAALDRALIEAASRPDSEARLAAVAGAARGLAATFSAVTDTVQGARMAADAGIAVDVGRVNEALAGVARLNAQILSLSSGGRDVAALMDQRQALIDGIAEVVPLREVPRAGGQVALYSAGGAVLIDGVRPATLGFTPAGVIVPEMTHATGALSGLTINGRPVDTGDGGTLSGGTLVARFALRDVMAPAAQAELDALARDLVTRLEPPGPDATLAPGAAGLFTDAGQPFDAVAEAGLAGRLRLNALADPAAGGALWRLRDGLGAAAPGAPGEARLLVAIAAALDAPRDPAPGPFMAGARSLSVLAAQAVSAVAARRLTAETEQSYSTARTEALRVAELRLGVDTDRELQDLLMIERAYGANARVVKTVDEMIQLLLGL